MILTIVDSEENTPLKMIYGVKCFATMYGCIDIVFYDGTQEKLYTSKNVLITAIEERNT